MALSVVAAGTVQGRDGGTVDWAVTGRGGGVSAEPFRSANLALHVGDDAVAVAENRRRLAATVGVGGLAIMVAAHGNEVAVVNEQGDVAGVDALVTDRVDLGLVALAADCATVALVADDDRTIAAVHCGWQGLANDVVGRTVEAIASRGVGIGSAVIGPSVCGRCYPVPRERAEHVRRECARSVWSAALVECADGQPGIDVGAGLARRIADLAPAAHVTRVRQCTVETAGLFSFRRDGRTGRHGLVIARRRPESVGGGHVR